MYENNVEDIKKASLGDNEAMTILIENNKRTNMEHSKKILWQRIRNRRPIPNRMYGFHQINKKI